MQNPAPSRGRSPWRLSPPHDLGVRIFSGQPDASGLGPQARNMLVVGTANESPPRNHRFRGKVFGKVFSNADYARVRRVGDDFLRGRDSVWMPENKVLKTEIE